MFVNLCMFALCYPEIVEESTTANYSFTVFYKPTSLLAGKHFKNQARFIKIQNYEYQNCLIVHKQTLIYKIGFYLSDIYLIFNCH
jgi:hypothetical protein